MSAGTLLALAERCEKASGPDRGIDLEIMRYAMNIGGPPETAKPYTASLDAAVTLVPGEWGTYLKTGRGEPIGGCDELDGVRQHFSVAATPALALTAAALRARAVLSKARGERG